MESKVHEVKSKVVGEQRSSTFGQKLRSPGARLQAERKRLRLTQEELAARAGIHRQTQVNYENDRREPPIEYLEAIGRIGIDSGYIVSGLRTGEAADLSALKNILLTFVLQALGYSDTEALVNEGCSIWRNPSSAQIHSGGLEGFAGRLVGDSPTLKSVRDDASGLDVDLFMQALSTAESVLPGGLQAKASKRAILACELYRSAKLSGAIDTDYAKTLAALAA